VEEKSSLEVRLAPETRPNLVMLLEVIRSYQDVVLIRVDPDCYLTAGVE
jgi:hypothetical protein